MKPKYYPCCDHCANHGGVRDWHMEEPCNVRGCSAQKPVQVLVQDTCECGAVGVDDECQYPCHAKKQ